MESRHDLLRQDITKLQAELDYLTVILAIPVPGTPGDTPHQARTVLASGAVPPCAAETAFTRAVAATISPAAGHIWPAASCTSPVRLHGTIRHIDTATGELLCDISTEDLPDGVIYKACGNRRATVCPSCAETYRRDAYQLVRAGLAGGKGIPATGQPHTRPCSSPSPPPPSAPSSTRVVRT